MHLYSDFIFCKNNFFNNPSKIVDLANSLDFNITSSLFPGTRTLDLAMSPDPVHQDFVKLFVKKLVNEVYTNITNLNIVINFHKYPVYENQDLNTGWIHTDHQLLAGVIYLNESAEDFTAGTSIYLPSTDIVDPDNIRENFNLDHTLIDIPQYIDKLICHNSQFTESIKVGNLYNRLITYDATLFHSPNNYVVKNSKNRLALLFIIPSYNYTDRPYNNQL
jgi:hypothetical protein